MVLEQYLQSMDGTEIKSIHYAGVVGINGDKVIMNGKQVDTIDTIEKAEYLFNEMINNQYGTNDTNAILTMEGF